MVTEIIKRLRAEIVLPTVIATLILIVLAIIGFSALAQHEKRISLLRTRLLETEMKLQENKRQYAELQHKRQTILGNLSGSAEARSAEIVLCNEQLEDEKDAVKEEKQHISKLKSDLKEARSKLERIESKYQRLEDDISQQKARCQTRLKTVAGYLFREPTSDLVRDFKKFRETKAQKRRFYCSDLRNWAERVEQLVEIDAINGDPRDPELADLRTRIDQTKATECSEDDLTSVP